MENQVGYCVRCKAKTTIKDPEEVEMKTKRGARRMIKGTCPNCGTKMCRFLGKKAAEEKSQETPKEPPNVEKEIKGFDGAIQ